MGMADMPHIPLLEPLPRKRALCERVRSNQGSDFPCDVMLWVAGVWKQGCIAFVLQAAPVGGASKVPAPSASLPISSFAVTSFLAYLEGRVRIAVSV
jgi:hypothetical protein